MKPSEVMGLNTGSFGCSCCGARDGFWKFPYGCHFAVSKTPLELEKSYTIPEFPRYVIHQECVKLEEDLYIGVQWLETKGGKLEYNLPVDTGISHKPDPRVKFAAYSTLYSYMHYGWPPAKIDWDTGKVLRNTDPNIAKKFFEDTRKEYGGKYFVFIVPKASSYTDEQNVVYFKKLETEIFNPIGETIWESGWWNNRAHERPEPYLKTRIIKVAPYVAEEVKA